MAMITKLRFALSAAIVLGAAYAASAGPLPGIDMEKMCRASAAVPFADNAATFDICMSDEQAAREKLVEDWSNIPAKDKARCVLPGEYLPGYIEWLTCLEMERDYRKIRQQQLDEQPARVPPGQGPFATHAMVLKNKQGSKFQPQAAQTAENDLTEEIVSLPEPHVHRSKPCRQC
jgi:hypothetical protein